MRLLARHPDIATANFYTAVVCGDLDAVNRALAADPGWATRPNGEPGLRENRRWRRRGSDQAGLGLERLGAALVSLLHALAAAVGHRQRRRDRTRAPGPWRQSQRVFHGRRQPVHAAHRRDRRRRRGPARASAARRARAAASRARRQPVRRAGRLQHPFQRQGPVVSRADLRARAPERAGRRTGPIRNGTMLERRRLWNRRAMVPGHRRRAQRRATGRVVPVARRESELGAGPATAESPALAVRRSHVPRTRRASRSCSSATGPGAPRWRSTPLQTLIAACLRDDTAAIRDEIAQTPGVPEVPRSALRRDEIQPARGGRAAARSGHVTRRREPRGRARAPHRRVRRCRRRRPSS